MDYHYIHVIIILGVFIISFFIIIPVLSLWPSSSSLLASLYHIYCYFIIIILSLLLCLLSLPFSLLVLTLDLLLSLSFLPLCQHFILQSALSLLPQLYDNYPRLHQNISPLPSLRLIVTLSIIITLQSGQNSRNFRHSWPSTKSLHVTRCSFANAFSLIWTWFGAEAVGSFQWLLQKERVKRR